MNRRDFLHQSSLAGAGVAAATLVANQTAGAAPAPADAIAEPGRIMKACKYSMVKEPDLSSVDTFKMLKDIGFDGTELRINNLDQQAEFQKAVDVSGLPVHGVVNGDAADISTAVKFSSDMGGSSVLIVCRYHRDRPLMDSWNEAQANIRKALPVAEERKVKILVENVWAGFLISALDTERFVDEINHPWFGSYYDVGNNVRWGVPEHWIEVLGERIGKLDIKEWDEKEHQQTGLRAGFSKPLGEGTINWENVRTALKKINFQNWATAEVPGGGRKELADIAQRMDKILGL